MEGLCTRGRFTRSDDIIVQIIIMAEATYRARAGAWERGYV